jgi:signal transduction histidine kinase
LLAEQQGAELARQLAGGLAQSVLPRALKQNLPLASLPQEVEQFLGGGWRRPLDEPLSRWSDYVVCLIKPAGAPLDSAGTNVWPYVLVYPPPLAPWPSPNPLDLASLPSPWAAVWEQALTHFHDGQYPPAAQALQNFLTNRPPEPFQAAARHRLAVCYLRTGNPSAARTNLSTVVLHHAEARGETGLPLAPFAQLQLLELEGRGSDLDSATHAAGAAPTPELARVNDVGRYALLRPSPFSRQLLDRLGAVSGESGRIWQRLWTVHERSRGLLESFLARTNSPKPEESRSLWLAEESGRGVLARWVAAAGNAGGALDPRYWLAIWPRDRLEQALKGSLRSQILPQYLAVGVEVAGADVTGGPEGCPVLATASGGGNGEVPELRVKVYLTDRAMLYARLRARRFWFGGLIAVSAGAVFVGYFAAWRAFQRQRQLAEMKGNFVSAVSHELRAPIASIRLMSEELEDIGPREPAKSRDYHHLIAQECRRLSSLIENVLDFSRHGQGRKEYVFEPTDLVALVQETVKLMQPCGVERRITLTTAFRGSPLAVAVDGRALQQALVNLLDNAIKHSPAGAAVAIGLEVDAAPLSPQQPSRNKPPPARLRLWVEDQGEGIPPQDHERIFERFYRRGDELRRQTPGIGLGLAIVKYIAEAHHGRVTVRSAVGEGSRFTMELPVWHPVKSA